MAIFETKDNFLLSNQHSIETAKKIDDKRIMKFSTDKVMNHDPNDMQKSINEGIFLKIFNNKEREIIQIKSLSSLFVSILIKEKGHKNAPEFHN